MPGFSIDTVEKVAEEYRRTKSQRQLAKKFNLTRYAIKSILAEAYGRGMFPAIPEEFALTETTVRYNADEEKIGHTDRYSLPGTDPNETPQPIDPKKVKFATINYNKRQLVNQSWVRFEAGAEEKENLWERFAEKLNSQVVPAKKISKKCPNNIDNQLTVYPIIDAHIGMLAWDKEAGDTYDLEVAQRLHLSAMDYLVDQAPPTKEALLAFMGDFLHYDSQLPVTPAHGHHLDSAARYELMVDVAVETLIRIATRALEKHEILNIVVNPGNHDPFSTPFMRKILTSYFKNNPRVKVDQSPKQFHYFQFGKTAIGMHHGHSVKMDQLPMLMAADQAQLWGDTLFRYWITAHIHHSKTKKTSDIGADYSGCNVESFRTMAAKDAYAAIHGYVSWRDMQALVFHKKFGMMNRIISNARMFV